MGFHSDLQPNSADDVQPPRAHPAIRRKGCPRPLIPSADTLFSSQSRNNLVSSLNRKREPCPWLSLIAFSRSRRTTSGLTRTLHASRCRRDRRFPGLTRIVRWKGCSRQESIRDRPFHHSHRSTSGQNVILRLGSWRRVHAGLVQAGMLESCKSASGKQSRLIATNWLNFAKRSGRKLPPRNTHASLSRYWPVRLPAPCR